MSERVPEPGEITEIRERIRRRAALARHALGPIGAAAAAYMIAVVQDGVRDADLWTFADGSRAPSLADSAPVLLDEDQGEDDTEDVPRWVPVRPGVRVRIGGEHVAGWVLPGDRRLLPVKCVARTRARAQALAKGAHAVAELEDWRAREQASATRTRMRAEALATAAGGSPRALATREHIVPEQGFARAARTVEPASADAGEATTERVLPAVEARRRADLAPRERIAAHPGHGAEQIASVVGVSTVRRHLQKMRVVA
ncbi:hypothetical protein ABZ234_03335 [Nocardiopsis sp. NPDC006198]|uniref:hypothetical protein n=1 Tax=Nocardiopsis sp. NPDC006198 TaxID=3154472 RepID=UPI0033A902D7